MVSRAIVAERHIEDAFRTARTSLSRESDSTARRVRKRFDCVAAVAVGVDNPVAEKRRRLSDDCPAEVDRDHCRTAEAGAQH